MPITPFWYGYPTIKQGAGRIKTDQLNQQRIQIVLDRYHSWAKLHTNTKFDWSITKEQLKRNMFLLPLAGFSIGILCSYLFVHPKSQYIGKCFTLLTTYFGYGLYKAHYQAYQTSLRFGNYDKYPEQIKRMIDNNDSRYAFKWLKDNYMELQ